MTSDVDPLLIEGARRSLDLCIRKLAEGKAEEACHAAGRAFELIGGALALDPLAVAGSLDTDTLGPAGELLRRLNQDALSIFSHEKDVRPSDDGEARA